LDEDGDSDKCATTRQGNIYKKDSTFNFYLKSVAWDDSTYPGLGDKGCDGFYEPNYNGASAIGALQTGALVQANWMALDEVLKEVDRGALDVRNPACQINAADMMRNIKNAAVSMKEAEACGRSLVDLKKNCQVSTEGKVLQSDCYLAGLISSIQGSGFVQVAECEVYTRANEIFRKLFIDEAGKSYSNQLKNWATLGCLHRLDMGALDSKGDIKREVRQTTEHLQKCFPKAYAVAFKAYVEQNPISHEARLVKKGIQDSYRGQVLDQAGNPYITITNGMITDNTPATTPGSTTWLTPEIFFQDLKEKLSGKKYVDAGKSVQNLEGLFLGIPFISLSTRLRSRKKKPSRGTKRFILPFLMLATVLQFSTGCTVDVRLLSFVHSYCVGNNGILLSGAQADKCCTYSQSSDARSKDIQGIANDSSGDVNTPCPGDPDDLLEDLVVRGGGTQNTIDNLVKNIGSLKGQMNKNNDLTDGDRLAEGETSYNPFNSDPLFNFDGVKLGATAGTGDTGDDQTNQNLARAGKDAKGGSIFPSGQNGGARGGGGSGGSGSGGGFLSSAMDAIGSKLGMNSAATADAKGEGASGTYSSGGAGGGNGGGAGRPNNEVDGSNIDWGLGGAKTASVGEGLETADPADYFDRMSASDNLFKKVEDRYKIKRPLFVDKR
jgi:hypothetical protein